MLVQQLIIDIFPKLSGNPIVTSLFSALATANNSIFARLMNYDSDLIKEDLDITIPADGNRVTLESDFRGLVDTPQIAGKKYYLSPLMDRDRAEYLAATAAPPTKYELRGFTFRVFPTPTEETSIVGTYYSKPADATTLSEALPYEGLFDQLFKDAVARIMLLGTSATIMAEFEAFVDEQIVKVISVRSGRKPRRVRGNYY